MRSSLITNHSSLTTNHLAGGYERLGAPRERQRLRTIALAAVLSLVVLALFFVWERGKASGVTYTHWGPLGPSAGDDYDEGAYVISAQLLDKGYALFSQVFSAQPAFFLPSLAVMVRIVSDPVVAGHLYEAVFGLATLMGVIWMAWTAYRPIAGPLAGVLLAVSPGFLLYAHAVEAEMPMLGLCTLAVAAGQSYYLSRRRVYAALAGLLLMAGTEMKLLSPVVALPVVLMLAGGAWLGHKSGRTARAIVGDMVAFALCLTLPALAVLALVSPAEQFRQAVVFHLHASAGSRDAQENMRALRVYLEYDVGLLVVAAVGTVTGFLSQSRDLVRSRYVTLVYLIWFLFTFLFLWSYHPLFQHQFVPLLPPLALLGAALAAAWRTRFQAMEPRAVAADRYTGGGPPSFSGAANPRADLGSLRFSAAGYWLVAPAVVYLVILGFRTLPIDRHLFGPPVTPRRDGLVALLDSATKANDFVVADDPMVALFAHRLMPPGMADPSRVRTTSGYLPVSEAIEETQRYHAAAIIASRPMFAFYLPQYLVWARLHYRAIPSPAPGAQVYLSK